MAGGGKGGSDVPLPAPRTPRRPGPPRRTTAPRQRDRASCGEHSARRLHPRAAHPLLTPLPTLRRPPGTRRRSGCTTRTACRHVKATFGSTCRSLPRQLGTLRVAGHLLPAAVSRLVYSHGGIHPRCDDARGMSQTFLSPEDYIRTDANTNSPALQETCQAHDRRLNSAVSVCDRSVRSGGLPRLSGRAGQQQLEQLPHLQFVKAASSMQAQAARARPSCFSRGASHPADTASGPSCSSSFTSAGGGGSDDAAPKPEAVPV